MIKTAVIPAAGMGTRLLTLTKETPKEMVPLFHKNKKGEISLRPLLEIIFENLYDVGFRNFVFVVGRGKENIENHLSPHYDFLDLLKKKNENKFAKTLSKLYGKIENSSLVWVRQNKQKGIGPAVLLTKNIVGDEPFLFHAGDLYIPNQNYFHSMIKTHQNENPDATIGLKKVKNPQRYGVAVLNSKKKINGSKIVRVVEKPKTPPSNYALTGVNIFTPKIFEAIEKTKKKLRGEIQLTDSIQTMISKKEPVVGSLMKPNEICIDVGIPEAYFSALKYSYSHKV
jgi:UTP--glucose-1-phosphate uridylyltransferase